MHIQKLKPHTGSLSPGCYICMKGTWACIFLTMQCTRSCFFCPQDKQKVYCKKPNLDGIFFDSSGDAVAFLKRFHFKGVGLSGGEPFLAYDTLLSYVTAIHREFGKQIYIWTYTNGDLVTEDRAKQLAEAGLNELRFDIAAREYDFSTLLMAKKYIQTITIETPLIPEDKKLLSAALKNAKKHKVSFINLHELYCSPYNQLSFKKRLYDLTSYGTVSETLEQGLDIITKEKKADKSLSIQICSSKYKNTVHPWSINNRYLPEILESYESCTERGFGRRLSFSVSLNKQKILAKTLGDENSGCYYDKKNKRLYTQLNALTPLLNDLNPLPFTLTYFTVSIQNAKAHLGKDSVRIFITPTFSIDIRRVIIQTIENEDGSLLKPFFQLFIQKKKIESVLYGLSKEQAGLVLKFYSQIKKLEVISII